MDSENNQHSNCGAYIPLSSTKNLASLEKGQIPGLRQGKYKMSQEPQMGSQSKKVKKNKVTKSRASQKDTGTNLKELPMTKAGKI